MAEYLPIFQPGQAVTYKASAAVAGGQVVAITGDGTVGPAPAAAVNWVGVASNDAAVNDNVTIYTGGIQAPVASGAVTAGDAVVCGAAGTVATGTDVATRVGIATSTAAAGDKVRVHFTR